MVQISKPYFSDSQRRSIVEAITQILDSGQVIFGKFGAQLESEFARRTATTHAISVNSCTTALQICLEYFGARGGEILVPAAAFTTDVSVAHWAGATPVLVDVDPETLSFDLQDLKRKISNKTKGIIWVHLTGIISSNFRDIVELAKRHSIFLLEDCAHSQGATIDGIQAGAIGDAACFSFFATKLMTCGAGGMITTNNSLLAKFATEMRLFGRNAESGKVVREGNDWFLDEFRACIALAQLREIDVMLDLRRSLAKKYAVALANQPGIRLIDIPHNMDPAYYQFPVFLDRRLDATEVGKALASKHGIQAKGIYRPLHHEDIFRRYDDGTLKNCESLLYSSLCLPMHPALTEEDVERVSAALIAEVRSRI